jgi:hypothetical protein
VNYFEVAEYSKKKRLLGKYYAPLSFVINIQCLLNVFDNDVLP